jgi:hypothetical protein
MMPSRPILQALLEHDALRWERFRAGGHPSCAWSRGESGARNVPASISRLRPKPGRFSTVKPAPAEWLFNDLAVRLFLLEYDSPRAGGFAPLRFVPADKMVVLGLVSTKSGVLETRDHLLRRIDEASHHVDLARLGVSSQCGFASVKTGNPITPEQQEAKLRLVVELAETVWGSAQASGGTSQ